MECALTIAGSDPTGGAGIQADLRVFKALGVHGMAVIAALTAQDTREVKGVYPVPPQEVGRQLDALLRDVRPLAIKTGMLYSADAVEAVANAMRKYGLSNLVIDPVAISTSGSTLLSPEGMRMLIKKLVPLCTVITPNLNEAAMLTGMQAASSRQDMERAAIILHDMGADTVIITGGHLEETATDLVYDGRDFHLLDAPMSEGNYHGTGCAFSACICALLALGNAPIVAARRAKELVGDAIRDAFRLSEQGMGILRF